jgi:hypothetical protein
VPDFLRDCGSSFLLEAATRRGQHADPSRRAEFSSP